MDLKNVQVVVPSKAAVLAGSEGGTPTARELVLAEMPSGLTDQQIVALRLLGKNRGTAEAAAGANVHPGTICRWKRDHAAFRAACALMQEQLFASVLDDLRGMAEDALLGVRMAIAEGDDPRLNLMLLKQLGYFKPPTDGER